MSLISSQPAFEDEISDLWDNPTKDMSVFDTADIIESYWSEAIITGYPVPPASGVSFVPKITYASLAPVASALTGTAAIAAAAFEAALSTMVASSLFVIPTPPFSTPPPVPAVGGAATPAALTAALTTIFTLKSSSSVAATVAGLFAEYLQGWMILVTVPPAAASLVAIV